jgi:hypothetical protein
MIRVGLMRPAEQSFAPLDAAGWVLSGYRTRADRRLAGPANRADDTGRTDNLEQFARDHSH